MTNNSINFFFIEIIYVLVLITAIENKTVCVLQKSLQNESNFPEHFKFGVATAAYQIEGGWNADGRGPSIWDTFTHQHPEMIDDHSNGDIGPDSYHLFAKDLKALKQLKVDYYRFSISWSRILPNADITSKNEKGIAYYNAVINELLRNDIEPMVTMFHYDLPESLNLYGGFTNFLFTNYFTAYAKLLFENFGNRVKYWITFNEPFDYCNPGYGNGNFPPMGKASGIADYLCMENTLKAHGLVYELYKTKYKQSQGGKIGITISSRFYFSKTNNASTVNRAMQFSLGWLAYPIFGPTGDYPPLILKDINDNSKKEGRAWPRLQSLNKKFRKLIKNSADFLGLNYYTSRFVEESNKPIGKQPSFEYDARLIYKVDPQWRRAKSKWLYCAPKGLEDLLSWIQINYNNIEVVITENGWSDGGILDDIERIDYIRAHLQAVLNALNKGCNVTHYTHWSLIDNFEWQRGYTEKFGLYYVNFTSPNRERIPKASAHFYKTIIKNRNIAVI